MKIALIGYGKMGKAIEEIAVAKGHTIVLKVGHENLNDFTDEAIQNADVAIEFSTPDSAFENVKKCISNGVPTVCGTTAWLDKLDEVKSLVHQHNTGFIYASNFSIGVNIFFAINEKLAQYMNSQTQYNAAVEEIHHTQKLDSPSGTAVTVAQGILQGVDRYTSFVNEKPSDANQLEIVSKRIDPAPGTHSVLYSSAIDDIEIIHTAHNRIGFASGAVQAAEFLIGKKGVFGMKEVLGL
jgi:4-hydroxy-tetrahydrodipicolinate reductase